MRTYRTDAPTGKWAGGAIKRRGYRGDCPNTVGKRNKRKHGAVTRYVIAADGSRWDLDPETGAFLTAPK